jgi:hypothetical protein
MEEDRETRTDEDVEAHVAKARNLGKDEEADDVEAHVAKARNLGKDEEGDDVEAHMLKNAVNRGVQKA